MRKVPLQGVEEWIQGKDGQQNETCFWKFVMKRKHWDRRPRGPGRVCCVHAPVSCRSEAGGWSLCVKVKILVVQASRLWLVTVDFPCIRNTLTQLLQFFIDGQHTVLDTVLLSALPWLQPTLHCLSSDVPCVPDESSALASWWLPHWLSKLWCPSVIASYSLAITGSSLHVTGSILLDSTWDQRVVCPHWSLAVSLSLLFAFSQSLWEMPAFPFCLFHYVCTLSSYCLINSVFLLFATDIAIVICLLQLWELSQLCLNTLSGYMAKPCTPMLMSICKI